MPRCMVNLIRQAKPGGDVLGVETRESRYERQGSRGCSLWNAEWSDLSEHGKHAQGTWDKDEEEMVVARLLRTLDGSHKCELYPKTPGRHWRHCIGTWLECRGAKRLILVSMKKRWRYPYASYYCSMGFRMRQTWVPALWLSSKLLNRRPQSPHLLPGGSNAVDMKIRWVNTYKKLRLFDIWKVPC